MRHVLAGALLASVALPAHAGAPTDSAALHLGRRDAVYAVAAGGLVTWAALRDRHASGVARATDTRFALDLAADAKRLGDTPTMATALVATDGLARLIRHPALGAATERIAVSILAAGAVTQALKTSLGRERPDESPNDAARFRPFSGHDSFPSGHATVAFAFAAAVDAETRARWVPFVVYPAATLTAWSRVRDGRHWPSDVVGAAAMAGWTAWKTDRWAQRRLPDGLWLLLWPEPRGARVTLGTRF